MKITEIIVSAGRTFNHPYENFSNLRPQVTFKAALEDGEDPERAAKDLQAKAESMIEDHKNHMLSSLHKLHEMQKYEECVASLEQTIQNAQRDLDALRMKQKSLIPESSES